MVSSDLWDERDAAVYDSEMKCESAPAVVQPVVEYLRSLADGGPALEFATGTGRIGIPLAQAGVPVTGIELSQPMTAQLRRKVDEKTLPVFVGDMATTRVPGEFSLVYLVFNTISNLRTQEEQVECFVNAARHLRGGGYFVVELWVPFIQRMVPGSDAVPVAVRDGFDAFDTYDVATQACTSQSYKRQDDGTIRYDIGRFRYAWPAELDLMARLAGLGLHARFSDWTGSPFTSASEKHVSVWRKP